MLPAALNIKQRAAIFKLILDNDNNTLKNALVAAKSVTKLIFQALEIFQPTIELFMTGSSPTLEMLNIR